MTATTELEAARNKYTAAAAAFVAARALKAQEKSAAQHRAANAALAAADEMVAEARARFVVANSLAAKFAGVGAVKH